MSTRSSKAEKERQTMIKALIVDDEYPARAELRFQLSRHEDVEVTGEAATAYEALRLIQGLRYDVIFIDIAMPGLSGIDLARQIRRIDSAPWVVFVTAYDEFALKAFETRALDYILKPISHERVSEALDRVRERLNQQPGQSTASTASPTPAAENRAEAQPKAQWIMGFRDDTAIPVRVEDVVYITSEDDQVFLYTSNEKYPVRYTLRELSIMLPDTSFFRCHRGYIVNLNQVREISPFFNGTYNLSVPWRGRAATVPVSRSRVPALKRVFWPSVNSD